MCGELGWVLVVSRVGNVWFGEKREEMLVEGAFYAREEV